MSMIRSRAVRTASAELLTAAACLAAIGAGFLADAALPEALSLGAVAAGSMALLAGRRSRARLLVDAGIAHVTIDRNGRVLEWAGAGTESFGYSRAEILGQNVSMLMPESVASEHDSYLARCVKEPDCESRVLGTKRQVLGRHRDGRTMPLTLFVRPVRRRGSLVFEGLIQLIPAAGGQRDNPQPEDFAPQLSWRWLRNLGHEIRTPMAGIQGHAEILVDPICTEEERRESANAILRNSKHLVELLSDLLDHARLTAGQLPVQVQTIRLREFLDDVAAMVRPNAAHRGVKVGVSVDPSVGDELLTDPLRLRQILLNLLGNALKFTHSGWVRVEVTRGLGDDGRLHIDVADTGAGIGGEFAPLLFQPFQQEHRAQTGTNGSGLGLSICRRLARLLGGDLVLVDSVPDVGSRFRVELPLGTCASQEGRPSESHGGADGSKPLAGMRVLVVDDARDLLYLTRRSLESGGAQVVALEHPSAALELSRSAPSFDVALLDLMMPEISGYELAQRLRATGFRGPMFALSATGDADAEQRCRDAGFDRLLSKPVGRGDLVAAVVESVRPPAAAS